MTGDEIRQMDIDNAQQIENERRIWEFLSLLQKQRTKTGIFVNQQFATDPRVIAYFDLVAQNWQS